jgi:hypothetical protein
MKCVLQYFKNKLARCEKVLEEVSDAWAKTTEELGNATLSIKRLKDQVEMQDLEMRRLRKDMSFAHEMHDLEIKRLETALSAATK